jgi:hypothetical protein
VENGNISFPLPRIKFLKRCDSWLFRIADNGQSPQD